MKYTTLFLSAILAGLLSSCAQVKPVVQENIARIDAMPNFPTPYKMLDWKQKAKDFDAFAFDYDSDFPCGPVIWLDSAKRNIPQVTFGIYTAIHHDIPTSIRIEVVLDHLYIIESILP